MTPCKEKGLKPGQWVWLSGIGWVPLVHDDGTKCPYFGTQHKGVGAPAHLGHIDWSLGIHNENPDWVPGERKGAEMTATKVLERIERHAREAGQSAKALAGEVERALEIAVKLANPPLLFDRSMLGDVDVTPGSMHYHRVPDTAFAIPGRERVKAGEPVTIQKGDYILREDIPDEATFDAVVAECERQGVELPFSNARCGSSDQIFVLRTPGGFCGWYINFEDKKYMNRRLTPADLGISTGKESLQVDAKSTLEAIAEREPEGDELAMWRDMANDYRATIEMIAEGLGVPYEPHQTFMERVVEAADMRDKAQPADESDPVVKESLTTDDPRHPDFWRDAPEGATHYAPETKAMASAWFKQGIDGPKVMVDGSTAWCTAAKIPSDAIPRPTSTPRKWDGEGLPPVGTVCEKAPHWHRCEIIAHHDGGLVVYDMYQLTYYKVGYGMNFRPLQSERERVIEKAKEALRKETGKWASSVVANEFLERMYDAGWLKEPEGE